MIFVDEVRIIGRVCEKTEHGRWRLTYGTGGNAPRSTRARDRKGGERQ